MALRGERALVGAWGHATAGGGYVYEQMGENWIEVAKLTVSDSVSGSADGFGATVALDGERAFVGAEKANARSVEPSSGNTLSIAGVCFSGTSDSQTWRRTSGLGRPLRAGQMILAGALADAVFVAPGDAVRVDFASLGSLSVSFS